MHKNKKLILPKGKNIIFISIYVLSFLIVQFYAVDKGMNILAFFKNLSIILFIIFYLQFDDDKYSRLKMIPYSATASVLVCFLLMLFENSGVFANNRLQGIFYYANSYGLFLLIGVFVIINNNKITWKDIIMLSILFIGIVLTNSRAIVILTLLTIIITLFTNKTNLKMILITILCFACVFGMLYLFSKIEKRIDSDMLGSSEFITRLLYYSDALNLIKDNPFGYGYDGWYYKQVEVQTGVYDTKYVHNSILQVALDVGVIPMIVLFAMLIITFFSKKQNYFSRMIMLLILGHSLIDIDLEYIYFILILILFIDFEKVEINKNKYLYIPVSILIIFYIFIFIGDTEFYCENYEDAVKTIPFHTEAIQEVLYSTAIPDKQLEYANKVLKLNKNVSGAYEAISNDLQGKNEYKKALSIEKKRLSLNKYTMYNYITFAQFLSNGIQYYGSIGEYDNAKIFLEEVVNIENIINDVLNKTNPLCYKTIHTPQLTIPDELQEFIDNSKEGL